jgi:uncharacterized protein YbjT (DUF2867 family)
MDNQPTLVLGATGTTGRRVAQRLQDAGYAVRAASRGGQAPFDWTAPATWAPAVTGTAGMYLMAPDGVSVEPSFVQLAVDRGIRSVRFRGADADYLAQQTALGAPEEQTRQEIEAFTALRALGDAQPTAVVRRVTGREPKEFATFAAEAAARGAWRG